MSKRKPKTKKETDILAGIERMPELVTVEQACEMLDLPEETIYGLVLKRKLKSWVLKNSDFVHITLESIESLMMEGDE